MIIDKDCKTITNEGRSVVTVDPDGKVRFKESSVPYTSVTCTFHHQSVSIADVLLLYMVSSTKISLGFALLHITRSVRISLESMDETKL